MWLIMKYVIRSIVTGFTVSIWGCMFVVLFTVVSLTAHATEVTITAEYRPTSNNPGMISFTNTTPCSLPGATQNWCNKADGHTPIAIVLSVPIRKRYIAGGNIMDEVYLRTPPAKNIILTNVSSDEQQELIFNIADIGYQTHTYNGNADTEPLHKLVPEGSSLTTPSGSAQCNNGGRVLTGTGETTYFFWGINSNSGATCYSYLKEGTDQEFEIMQLFLGYTLQTGSPSTFSNGTYQGSLQLTVGPEGDISFGNTNSNDIITIHFEIVVHHAFRIQFPPDSTRVTLAPQGGWGQWLNSGRMPPLLRRDIPFSLTTSGPIAVSLECQYKTVVGCGLLNEDNDNLVPLATLITLPGLSERMFFPIVPLPQNNRSSNSVENYPLHWQRKGIFYPFGFSYERRSVLRFEVERESVQEMIKHPGTTWRGDVIVMFDADLNAG